MTNMLMTSKISEQSDPSQPSLSESIEIVCHVQINNDVQQVEEQLTMHFNKNITIKEILKEIVVNFNSLFEAKNIGIRFKPDGLEYDLERYSDEENVEKEQFQRRKKLIDVNCTEFTLLYSPQDIMLNFNRSKPICSSACFII